MVGRPTKNEIKTIEDKICTIAWFNSVLVLSQTKNANHFSNKFFGETQRKWSNYSKGLSTPTVSTLKIIEQILPGSLSAFERGIEDGYLFKAMFADIDEVANLFGSGSDSFCWLSSLIPGAELWQIENDALQATLIGLENTLLKDSIFEPEYYILCPTSYSDFFTCCVTLLRFAIDRDKYHSHSYVLEYSELVLNCLGNKNILNLLDTYGIKHHFLEWLHYSLFDWIMYSKTGYVLLVSGDFPTLNDFQEQPRLFLDRYKKARDVYDQRESDAAMSLELALDNLIPIERLKEI